MGGCEHVGSIKSFMGMQMNAMSEKKRARKGGLTATLAKTSPALLPLAALLQYTITDASTNAINMKNNNNNNISININININIRRT